MVVELNTQALGYYNRGEYIKALALWKKACMMDNDEFDRTGRDHETGSCTAADSASKVLSLPATTETARQRNEAESFDEGLRFFENVEIITDWDSITVAKAILWFNSGQARRQLHDMRGAVEAYARTWAMLQEDADSSLDCTISSILLPSLLNLGYLWYQQEEIEKAISCLEVARTYASQGVNCRNDRIVLAKTLTFLGVVYYHKSTPDDKVWDESALACFGQAYQILYKVLGTNDDKDIATILNNIGRVHVNRDRQREALWCYIKALAIRQQVLGRSSLDYAATAFNIGQSLQDMGQPDRAMELYKEFLRVATKYGGEGQPLQYISLALSSIALILQEKKQFEQALVLYEEALQMAREAFGNVHSEVASLWNRIGNLHVGRGEADEALRCYQEGLAIDTVQCKDDTHPNIVTLLTNMGEAHRQMCNFDKALQIYHDVLDRQQRRYGDNKPHLDIASSLNAIGVILDQQGKFVTALQYLERALEMKRTLLGESSLTVSLTLMHLGSVLYNRRKITEAMTAFTHAFRIRIQHLGRDHKDVALALYNIGLCNSVRCHYREAIDCFAETLRIEQLVLGDSHRDVAMTQYKLGQAYFANGDLNRALFSYREALRIERELKEGLIFDAATIGSVFTQMAEIYRARDDLESMMDVLMEAARVLREAGFNPHTIHVTGHPYIIDEASCVGQAIGAPAA